MFLDPDYIRDRIRTVPDWPEAGVMFRDITPLLQDAKTFRALIDMFVYRYMGQRLDLVAGIDARGFILASVVAYELNLGFVPVRKKGKLPFASLSEEYALEYGSAAVEMHADAVRPGQRVAHCSRAPSCCSAWGRMWWKPRRSWICRRWAVGKGYGPRGWICTRCVRFRIDASPSFPTPPFTVLEKKIPSFA
jgi:hypothetical protein